MAFFNKLFGKNAEEAPAPKQSAASRTAPAAASGGKKDGGEQLKNPLPCGAWLALKGASKDAIVQALGMTEVTPCTWEDGLRGVTGGKDCRLFVTKPVDGCNLVIGSALPDLAYRTKAASWVTDLGAYIPSVYAFACQKNVQVYAFAQVEEQALYRIYAVAQGSVRSDRGERSDAEEALGYTFPANDDQLFEPEGLTLPSEETIRALAAFWSVDPASVCGTGGMIGKVAKI